MSAKLFEKVAARMGSDWCSEADIIKHFTRVAPKHNASRARSTIQDWVEGGQLVVASERYRVARERKRDLYSLCATNPFTLPEGCSDWIPERLVDATTLDGNKVYLTKWVGQPSERNSWQAPNTLTGFDKLLRVFQKEFHDQEPQGETAEVERIIKKKKHEDTMYYYTKWKGWSDKHNTWQTAESFANPATVPAFELKVALAEARASILRRVHYNPLDCSNYIS